MRLGRPLVPLELDDRGTDAARELGAAPDDRASTRAAPNRPTCPSSRALMRRARFRRWIAAPRSCPCRSGCRSAARMSIAATARPHSLRRSTWRRGAPSASAIASPQPGASPVSEYDRCGGPVASRRPPRFSPAWRDIVNESLTQDTSGLQTPGALTSPPPGRVS